MKTLIAAMLLAAPALTVKDVLTWPRQSSVKFGCMLEQKFKTKDPVYNCAAKAVPAGDPCKDTEHYYAGPKLPEVRVAGVERVSIDWEHGDLQAVTLELAGKPGIAELEKLLGIKLEKDEKPDGQNVAHANGPKSHPNIMSVSVQNCSKTGTCVLIQGFSHMGSADVECPL